MSPLLSPGASKFVDSQFEQQDNNLSIHLLAEHHFKSNEYLIFLFHHNTYGHSPDLSPIDNPSCSSKIDNIIFGEE